MPRADGPVSDAPGAESSAVEENGAAPPAGQSNTATSTARTGAAVDTVLPAKVAPHGESEELVRAARPPAVPGTASPEQPANPTVIRVAEPFPKGTVTTVVVRDTDGTHEFAVR
jgi:hypothetical protein